MNIDERIKAINAQVKLLELRHQKNREETERLLKKIEKLLKKIK